MHIAHMLVWLCERSKKLKKKLAGGELGFLTPGYTVDLRYLTKKRTCSEFF